ncbi:hypothetical protein E3T43_12785 [Cryobacterium sp. Hh7]|uniref:hypothetical protein n=1 Tax=Cryobacterium sp. Hh7 TaxID=1259159 RepID=UPI0010696E93|nr:hypothetical protein [Cryobacterium sp. Hh7]TFD54397.1 hypothetical protein E3T43_12785 [Cryobacterium sp. Hh7]
MLARFKAILEDAQPRAPGMKWRGFFVRPTLPIPTDQPLTVIHQRRTVSHDRHCYGDWMTTGIKPSPQRTVLLIAVVALLAVIGTAAVVIAVTMVTSNSPSAAEPEPTPQTSEDVALIREANRARAVIKNPVREGCTPIADDVVEPADSGTSVQLVSHGFGLISCVLEKASAPDVIYQRMELTRAIDGQQTADWDYGSAYWSYDGFNDALRATIEYTGPDPS